MLFLVPRTWVASKLRVLKVTEAGSAGAGAVVDWWYGGAEMAADGVVGGFCH